MKDNMKKFPALGGNNNAASFGGQMMKVLTESGIQSHVWHLQGKLYSQHMALSNYYSSIPGLIDDLIETYQGLHGVRISGNMNLTIDSVWSETKPSLYFKTLRMNLDKLYQNEFLQPGSLKNIMDEIIGLVGKTEYLLSLKN